MSGDLIALTEDNEFILLIIFIIAIGLTIATFFAFLIARRKFGFFAVGKQILTFIFSGVYYTWEMCDYENGRLESRGGKLVFDARNRVIYKAQAGGGVLVALVKKFQTTTEALHHYIYYLQIKHKNSEIEELPFDSEEEAQFYFYEKIFVRYSKESAEWKEQALEEMNAAKRDENGSLQAFKDKITLLLPDSNATIFRTTLDGLAFDARGLTPWMGTTSPHNRPSDELERGMMYEEEHGRASFENVALYIGAFIALTMAGVIAYTVIG